MVDLIKIFIYFLIYQSINRSIRRFKFKFKIHIRTGTDAGTRAAGRPGLALPLGAPPWQCTLCLGPPPPPFPECARRAGAGRLNSLINLPRFIDCAHLAVGTGLFHSPIDLSSLIHRAEPAGAG